MKKVIHSPEMGQSKTLLDYGQSPDLEEKSSHGEGLVYSKHSDTPSPEEIKAFRESIVQLREENELIKSDQLKLQKKYDDLYAEVEQHKQTAKDAGYQEGLSKAKTEINDSVEERVILGETLLSEIKKGILTEIYDQEGICLEIIYSAVSRLIGDAAGSKEQIKAILKLTMEKVASQDNLHIYLSEKDYATLKDDAFVQHNVIKSDELEYGGCIIKTGKGTVEAKLNDQLEKLKQLLLDIHRAQ